MTRHLQESLREACRVHEHHETPDIWNRTSCPAARRCTNWRTGREPYLAIKIGSVTLDGRFAVCLFCVRFCLFFSFSSTSVIVVCLSYVLFSLQSSSSFFSFLSCSNQPISTPIALRMLTCHFASSGSSRSVQSGR